MLKREASHLPNESESLFKFVEQLIDDTEQRSGNNFGKDLGLHAEDAISSQKKSGRPWLKNSYLLRSKFRILKLLAFNLKT